MALHHTKAITCVAISPDGGKLAAGDATGRILIWHDVAATLASRAADLAAQKQRQRELTVENTAGGYETEEEAMDLVEPPAATVHWHAHAVGALTFSLDGKYLLSGGQEAVLVIWDVESGRRAYLPRLGGPLTGITPCPSDPALYAVRQADNTLRVINAATMTVEASVHGMRPLPRAHLEKGAPPPPLTVAPGSGLAVVTGPHAVLQWYDLTRDAHVDKLQLSARSVVSLTETDAAALGGVYGPPPEPAALEVAFSRDSGAMATVETRPDPAGGGAVQHCLKFWDRAAPGDATYGSPYRLNTLADQPHR
jgi:NET1-associated nuclear protein 1 (U3 small nucleolar RNA-associated protein 17)